MSGLEAVRDVSGIGKGCFIATGVTGRDSASTLSPLAGFWARLVTGAVFVAGAITALLTRFNSLTRLAGPGSDWRGTNCLSKAL